MHSKALKARPRMESLEARDVPSFLPPVSYALNQGCTGVAIADLNGDGRRDVASACPTNSAAPGKVAVFLGDGSGVLYPVVPKFDTGVAPYDLGVGDFSGDGKPDLVTSNMYGNTLSVLLGNGDGTFQPYTDFSNGAGAGSLAIADFNQDGKLDVAATTNFFFGGEGAVNILFGNGDGTLQAPVSYPAGTPPAVSVETSDMNGDGWADLVVNGSGQTMCVYLNRGDGTFQPSVITPVSNGIIGYAIGDVNKDGRLDLVITSSDETVGVRLGNGDGTFASGIAHPVGPIPHDVVLADVNRDRKLDIVLINYGSARVGVLLGNGNGTFQSQVEYPINASGPGALVAGDLTNDRYPDLVVYSGNKKDLRVLINDTAWAAPIPPPPGRDASALLRASSAIDAGDNTDAPEFDQRGPGFPRIVNGTIDNGAFEVQASPAPSPRPEIEILAGLLATADLASLT